MKWLLFSSWFFILLLSACSEEQPAKKNSNKATGESSKATGESATSNKTSQGAVTVLCRCGKGYVSWSGEDESSVKEVVKKNCESLSQSIKDCQVKKQ